MAKKDIESSSWRSPHAGQAATLSYDEVATSSRTFRATGPDRPKEKPAKEAESPPDLRLAGYKSDESLAGCRNTWKRTIRSSASGVRKTDEDLPVSKLSTPDVAVFFTRRLKITGDQLDRVKITARQADRCDSHRSGFQNWLDMDKEVLGGDSRDASARNWAPS